MSGERFDPARDDPRSYMGSSVSRYHGEGRSRGFLVLNSLLTRAVVESLREIKKLPRKQRSRIALLGEKPKIKNNKPYKSRSDTRLGNVGVVDSSGNLHFDRIYFSMTRGINGVSGFEVPIGEYGEKLAFATIQAARAVSALLNKVEPAITSAGPEYRQALDITFQHTIKGALLEGTQTLAGQFALLAATKVDGYRNPMKLFDELRKQGIFNAWAAAAEFGQTAPRFDGRRATPAHPLVVTNGKLKLSRQLKDSLREGSRAQVDGCPVSRRNTPISIDGHREVVSDSGINLLAELFGQYLKYYYRRQMVGKLSRLIMTMRKNVPSMRLKK